MVERDCSYIVMEYVAGGTLETHSPVDNLLPVGQVVRDHLQVRAARSNTRSSTA